MKALVIDRPNQATFTEVDEPAVGINEVLIRSRKVGVCPTDLEILRGEVPSAWVRTRCERCRTGQTNLCLNYAPARL